MISELAIFLYLRDMAHAAGTAEIVPQIQQNKQKIFLSAAGGTPDPARISLLVAEAVQSICFLAERP